MPRASSTFSLVWPGRDYLDSYIDALRHGWSPDNVRGAAAASEQLEAIASDPDGFLAKQIDREARAGRVKLPDGSEVPRLPGFHRWLWDGEFCGSISVRWQPGTEELPPHCLGHIGYAVVPWKRRRGYATRALGLFLADVRSIGLRYVDITTDVTNVPSQRVIESNGGVLVQRFTKLALYGGQDALRYRVQLQEGVASN